MGRLFQIFILIFMLVSIDVGASPQLLNVASKASDHGTLVLGRFTGIPGMFGRFTVILNGKLLGMLGENQIIKKRLTPGRYTLTIRDDVEYRKFLKFFIVLFAFRNTFLAEYFFISPGNRFFFMICFSPSIDSTFPFKITVKRPNMPGMPVERPIMRVP